MAWNISKEKRRALVKLQLRDKHGRFVEMGNGVKWFSSLLGKEVSGEVVGGEGSSAVVRLNADGGNKLVKVPAKNITVIDSKGTLTPKGEKPALDAPDAKPNAVGQKAKAPSFAQEGKGINDVSAEEMSKMPAGTIL